MLTSISVCDIINLKKTLSERSDIYMMIKRILTVVLIFTLLLASLVSCGGKSGINEREIKNIVVDAIKEDLDSSYAIVTAMNYTIQDNILLVRAKVLLPEYCFYEIKLEKQESDWVVIYCGKDV